MKEHKQLTCDIKLHDHGWVDARLSNQDSTVELAASYICDALGDLVRAVIDLYKSPALERQCSWFAEPGEYRWVLNRVGDDVDLQIVWHRNYRFGADSDKGEVLFQTTATLKRLATQVHGQMRRILNEFGREGYRNRWRREFPTDELAELVSLIDVPDESSHGAGKH